MQLEGMKEKAVCYQINSWVNKYSFPVNKCSLHLIVCIIKMCPRGWNEPWNSQCVDSNFFSYKITFREILLILYFPIFTIIKK